MSEQKHSRAKSRKKKALLAKKRRQRRNRLIAAAAAVAVVLIVAGVLLLRRPAQDAAAPAPTPEPTEIAAATPEPTAAVTPEPTPEPTETPEPTPTPVSGEFPDVVSFYQPEGKPYSPRVRMDEEFTAKFKKEKDLGSFEVIASEEERLEGDFFGDIFGAAWKSFADADQCRIGYALRYTLDDDTEIQYTMRSPDDIKSTKYVECWLYDDYHREPHKTYSHIKKMKDDTLITSIKLTGGRHIADVKEIWLTAFIYHSQDDFDMNGNYLGETSCTLHITKE